MEPSNFSDQAGQAKRHLAHEPGNLTERQSAGPAPPQSPVTLKTQSEKRATRAQTPCIACRQRHLEQCDETWPSCRKTKSAHVASWPRVPGREARHYGHSFVPIPRASDIALPASSRNVSPSPLPSERFQNRSLDDPFRLSSRFQERRKKVEREEERARAAVIGNSFHGREMEELPSQLHDYFVFDSGINLSTGERIRATDNSGNVPLNGEVESGFPINALSHSEYWPSTIPESPPFFPGLGLQMPLEDPPELSHAQGSGATTVPMDQAQRDISELSGTIHGRISENVDLDDGKLPSSKQNAPFTDSGYASGINIDHLPQMELGDANTSGYGNNDIGSKTVYSGASTVPMDQAQRYISELCSTIHGRINENIDVDNWTSLSERLSELIKDFAIKLGLESSVQINQDIMYFIHKRGREIAKQLDSMVLSVDAPTEDIDGGQKAKGDHMPLNDKMALWTSKDIEIETSLNASELFVGVTDIEETLDIPELSKYNEAVTESNSFKWLIESLRRELVLNRDPDKSGGCKRRICEAALLGKVRRFIPWQFGVDYDVIGRGSPQELFDEQLDVRDALRAQKEVAWVIISTGLFTSFLFVKEFGVVDFEETKLRALGGWDTEVTLTSPDDIAKMTAEVVYNPRGIPDNGQNVVYISGDTVSYKRVADLVEQRFPGAKFVRETWDTARLMEKLQKDPTDIGNKYRAIFGAGKGISWPKEATLNSERGIQLEDLETFLRKMEIPATLNT